MIMHHAQIYQRDTIIPRVRYLDPDISQKILKRSVNTQRWSKQYDSEHVFSRPFILFDVVWWFQWYLAATRSSRCYEKPDAQHMLNFNKTPETIPCFFHKIIACFAGWVILTIFVAEQNRHLHVWFCTQKLSICMFDFCWSFPGKKKLPPWQNKKISVDYALHAKNLCKAKLLSVTFW